MAKRYEKSRGFVKIKKTKLYQTTWIKTNSNNILYTLIRFTSYMKKSDKNKKCAHNEKHSFSAHHFATSLVLKYQPFLAGKMYIFGCSKYEMSSSRSNKTFHIANGIKLAKHRSCFQGFFFSKI